MNEDIKEILEHLSATQKINNGWTSFSVEECKGLYDYITNLQKTNELHNKILKDANDVLNIQAQKGNYNYDSYMLGLYNGMEMIVSLFEQREPKFKCGKDIKFLHETDYKSRNEKAIEWCKCVINSKTTVGELPNGKRTDIGYCLDLAEPLLNILKGVDEE